MLSISVKVFGRMVMEDMRGDVMENGRRAIWALERGCANHVLAVL